MVFLTWIQRWITVVYHRRVSPLWGRSPVVRWIPPSRNVHITKSSEWSWEVRFMRMFWMVCKSYLEVIGKTICFIPQVKTFHAPPWNDPYPPWRIQRLWKTLSCPHEKNRSNPFLWKRNICKLTKPFYENEHLQWNRPKIGTIVTYMVQLDQIIPLRFKQTSIREENKMGLLTIGMTTPIHTGLWCPIILCMCFYKCYSTIMDSFFLALVNPFVPHHLPGGKPQQVLYRNHNPNQHFKKNVVRGVPLVDEIPNTK